VLKCLVLNQWWVEKVVACRELRLVVGESVWRRSQIGPPSTEGIWSVLGWAWVAAVLRASGQDSGFPKAASVLRESGRDRGFPKEWWLEGSSLGEAESGSGVGGLDGVGKKIWM